jgi:hypothetical protein
MTEDEALLEMALAAHLMKRPGDRVSIDLEARQITIIKQAKVKCIYITCDVIFRDK